jgi:hypothetical protein
MSSPRCRRRCDRYRAPAADGHIGRMAVLADWRGKGVGRALLERLLEEAAGCSLRHLALHAQTHASGFYRRFGFVEEGPEFMEAGIPHRAMVRRCLDCPEPEAVAHPSAGFGPGQPGLLVEADPAVVADAQHCGTARAVIRRPDEGRGQQAFPVERNPGLRQCSSGWMPSSRSSENSAVSSGRRSMAGQAPSCQRRLLARGCRADDWIHHRRPARVAAANRPCSTTTTRRRHRPPAGCSRCIRRPVRQCVRDILRRFASRQEFRHQGAARGRAAAILRRIPEIGQRRKPSAAGDAHPGTSGLQIAPGKNLRGILPKVAAAVGRTKNSSRLAATTNG